MDRSNSSGGCGFGCGGAATAARGGAPAPGEGDGLSPGAADVSALLASRDARLLTRAVKLALEAGTKIESVAPLWAAMDEILALSQGAEALLAGRAQPGEFLAQLGAVEPWPAKLLSGRWGKAGVPAALQLPSVGAMLGAGFVGGSFEGGFEFGRQCAARVVTALLWRTEPLARVLQAARALDARQLDLGGFRVVLSAATQLLTSPPNPAEFVSALSLAPVVLPMVPGAGIDGPWWPPRKPPFSVWLLPENQAWAHCALGLAQAFKPLPDIPKVSPGPARIVPASICGGTAPTGGWQITLEGNDYGTQGDWGVAVNGRAARVVSWADTAIVIETRDLRPGCNAITWSYRSNWAPDDNGVGAACVEALRLPRATLTIGTEFLLAQQGRHWVQPGSISVLAPRIADFSASAGVAGAAEPCAEVTLSWRIEDLPCAPEGAALQVSLWRDGQPLATGLGFDGLLTERDPIDRDLNYRLVVASSNAAGLPCAEVSRTLTVRRAPKRLALSGPAEVTPRGAGRVTLRIPCPAPAGGLDVMLASMPAGRLSHLGSVRVPADDRELQFDVSAGPADCGPATLTASATDHADGTWGTCTKLPPRIVGFAPPAGLKACERFTMQVAANCVAVPPALQAFAVDAAGTREALTVAGLAAPGSCSAARALTLTGPKLPPGAYTLTIENDLGAATAPTGFDLAPNPRIVRAPQSLSVDDPCGAGARKTLTVTVSGADAVEFSYLGASQTVMRRGSGSVCDEWQASFSFDFSGNGMITSVPLLGGVRGSSESTDVALLRSAAVNIYRLRGPSFMNVSAQLTLVETAKGSQPVRTPAGSIGPGQERDFVLTRCVFSTIEYEYTVNGSKVSGAVPEKLGHPDGETLGPIQI